MPVSPIRTITLGLADPHPLTAETIQQVARILEAARLRYQRAGYEVQTLRLSTRPLYDDLSDWSAARILQYCLKLQDWLTEFGLEFCSLGPMQAARRDFPLARIEELAEIIGRTDCLNATVQLATAEDGLRFEAALPAAKVMQQLAQETPEGFGNFRFAILACVPPGTPFFPAAYHAGPSSISLGLQGAPLVEQTLLAHQNMPGEQLDLEQVTSWLRVALIEEALPIIAEAQAFAAEQQLAFGGIDLSPAPMGEAGITTALELCGFGPIGSPGTLAAASALTAALKSTDLPTCGYCGLMLPVLEDAVLGKRWEEGQVNVHQLLLYSMVCGTGLDTVPLPGDTPASEIAALLLDVATLAVRWNKPLSARLFPVPGKQAGDLTTFSSPYLTNTRLHSLRGKV